MKHPESVDGGVVYRLLVGQSDQADVACFVGQVAQLAQVSVDYRHVATAVALQAALRDGVWDLLLCDVGWGGLAEAAVMQMTQGGQRPLPTLFLADTPTTQAAVDIMRLGACGYAAKADLPRVADLLRQALTTPPPFPLPHAQPTQAAWLKGSHVTESYLDNILNTMQDAIISIAFPSREVEFVSASFADVFGLSVQELMQDQTVFQRIVHPADLEKTTAARQICLQQGFVELDHRVVHKDGQVRWLHRRAWTNYDENGRPIRVVDTARDITTRKLAEEALRHSETRFREFMNHLPGAVSIEDQAGGMVFCNEMYAQRHGHSLENLLGKTVADYLPSDLAEMFARENQQVFARGQAIEFNNTFATPNGAAHWLSIKFPIRHGDDPPLLGAISLDVTRERQAEIALQESHVLLEQRVVERTAELRRARDRLEAIFNFSGDGILLLDKHMRIQQANETFRQLFDVQQDSCLGALLTSWFRSADARAVESLGRKAIETRRIQRLEAQARRYNKSIFDVEISIAPVRQADVDVSSSLVCIIRNVSKRKQAERTLRESEARYQSVVETQSELICRYLPDLTLTFVNGAYCRYFGKEPEELLGKSFLTLIPEAEREAVRGFYAELVRNKSRVVTEHSAIAADGSVRWQLWTDTAVTNDAGEVVMLQAVGMDITERKQAEDALRESEARYRLLAENIQDVIVKLTADASITFATPSSVTLTGHSPDALIGRSVTDLLHPDDVPLLHRVMQQAQQTQAPFFTLEQRLRHVDGHYVWVEISNTVVRDAAGVPVEVIGILHDITERKQAEDALRTSEERFRQFVEAAPIATIITNRMGEIVLVNKETEKLFGYGRDELIGRTVDIFVPEFRKKAYEAYRQDFLGKQDARRFLATDMQALCKDGALFWADIQVSTVTTEHDELIMSLVIDVSHRKQAEAALREALAHEKELGELKSRFVSMASHEFRTPLTAILAAAETLLYYRERMDDDQIEGRLHRIRRQVHHMKDITEDVLQLSRIQAGRVPFKAVMGNLDALCQDIVAEFDSQPTHHGRILYTSDCGNNALLFDPQLMRQAVVNLITNALKYSPREQPVQLCLKQELGSVVVSVLDKGIGIPDKDLKHLFEPFHRATNVGSISGTGLGLSIARQAVALHGGEIVADSRVGSGSTFTISIPIHTEEINDHDQDFAD